ncbi:hypothetical protein ACS0TY_012926 [Phlomoides rotata]
MVLRNEFGEVCVCRCSLVEGLYAVDVGEAFGVLEALSWIKRLDVGRVVIEMDSKLVFDALTNPARDRSVFGDVIESCKILSNPMGFITFNWVGRNANGFAHLLARNARNYPSPYNWVESSSFFEGVPNFFCSCK